MAQVGDIVPYLNAVGGGRIVKIEGNIAYVDEDGFETPVMLRECVVVTPAGGAANARKTESKYVAPSTIVPEQPKTPKPETVEETETGEKLNIVLAYEPAEIKHLNTTTYDAYLVNDSNYYLYFTYLTRADEQKGWVTRYAGIVEPNIQVFLGEVTHEDLPEMDRVAVQYVAFKRDKEFALKAPVAVEYRLDTTKFFKLHCFHDNVYFDTPVIAVDIVKNDIPCRSMVIDSGALEDAMRAKRQADRPMRQPVKRHKEKTSGIIEVDLHIHELLDTTAGLSNSEMLEVQLKEFRRVMDENIHNKGCKIVFIHGKGEGVLRNALLKELKKYPRCQAQDASFREYGFGATQITIH